jgi:ketosteroid isomerase-like protein
MSEENVEIVRSATEAVNAFLQGEVGSEALTDVADAQVEMHWGDERTLPDFPQHVDGVAGAVELFTQLREAWHDLTVEQVELMEAPDDRVLTLMRLSGRGRQSNVPIVLHYFQLWTIRNGRVGRCELFRHRADALEAARLRE